MEGMGRRAAAGPDSALCAAWPPLAAGATKSRTAASSRCEADPSVAGVPIQASYSTAGKSRTAAVPGVTAPSNSCWV